VAFKTHLRDIEIGLVVVDHEDARWLVHDAPPSR
jgi:hypothetical protein